MKTFRPLRFTRQSPANDGCAPGFSLPGADPVEKFRQLILPHLDGAYNLARYLTRDPALSEDVVQDAMLRAFRGFAQFRGGSSRAWLFTIVRNCSRTAKAGSSNALSLVVNESSLGDGDAILRELPDTAPNPEEEALRNADAQSVRAAIEAIPEPFREAVVLRDLEDLSYGEIAEVTAVPIGTVMSRLARGRAMLAKELLPLRDEGMHSRSVR